MIKMTAAHLEAVKMAYASLDDEAKAAIAESNCYKEGSLSWLKYRGRARIIAQYAARLSEVAAHIAKQIEGADDAG